MRRFLMGLISGGVLSAAALGLLSQMTLRGSDALQSAAQSTTDGDMSSSLQSGAIPVESDTEVEAETEAEVEAAPEVVADSAIESDTASEETAEQSATVEANDTATTEDDEVAASDTDETNQPAEITETTEADMATDTGTSDSAEGANDEATEDANAQNAASEDTEMAEAPSEDPDQTVTQDTPAPVEDPNADAPVPDVSQTVGQAPAQDTVTIVAPTVVDRDTGEEVEVTASLRSASAPDAPSDEGVAGVSTTPAVRPVIEADNSQTQQPADEAAQDAQTEPETADTAEGEDTAQADTVAPSPTIGTAGGDLKSLAPSIKINRLPTLGDDREPEAETTEAVVVTPEVDMSDKPVLERFATAFENPDEKPLMSIVLMDQGAPLDGSEVGVDALGQFPHPITLAVDSRLPDAADRMTRYRDAGFEVMALVDIPAGFTAQDTEVSMGVILSDLPDVIGVLEGIDSGLQSDRAVSRQVASILAQTGHGLITQDKGLNSGLQFAEREGVPAKAVFRDIDSNDQTAVVIRRFLDQAAFKAAQEDGIVMLGRVRPETISALLLWGLQERAKRVAIAPASAVLLAP